MSNDANASSCFQDPHNLQNRNLADFHYVKNELAVVDEGTAAFNRRKSAVATVLILC